MQVFIWSFQIVLASQFLGYLLIPLAAVQARWKDFLWFCPRSWLRLVCFELASCRPTLITEDFYVILLKGCLALFVHCLDAQYPFQRASLCFLVLWSAKAPGLLSVSSWPLVLWKAFESFIDKFRPSLYLSLCHSDSMLCYTYLQAHESTLAPLILSQSWIPAQWYFSQNLQEAWVETAFVL